MDGLLCRKCWAILHRIKRPRRIANYNSLPFPIFYLFEWVADQSPLLNSLLICLKNPRTSAFHKRFAELLTFERGLIGRPVVIPTPATRQGDQDHAYYLAYEIAHLYKTTPKNTLIWQDKQGKQREKGKKDRASARMVGRGLYKKEMKNQVVILVDDIITTGSTALKAYEALGSPKDFELWCLACRNPAALI